MKVVWWYDKKYTIDRQGFPFEHAATSMRMEFMKRGIDLVTYGNGWGTTEPDARKIEKMENPDFFVIFCCQTKLENLDKVKCHKVMKCSDPWANVWSHVRFAKRNEIDLLLPIYWDATHKYRELLKGEIKVEAMPLWVNTDWFKDLGLEREWDAFLTGAFGASAHPLRAEIVKRLREMSGEIKVFIKPGHGLSFKGYIETINKSKIFPFGCVELPYLYKTQPIKWAIGKWTEAMSCRTLVMANKPTRAEDLHFESGENFVEVNASNFLGKLEYYLKDEDERLRIATNGYETIQKYHTLKVRADEILKHMENI